MDARELRDDERTDDVIAVLTALREERVEYVLVGGVAIGLHGYERATRYIDLFVRPTEERRSSSGGVEKSVR